MLLQEAVNRVRGLEEMGYITGVIDDRGKFIYISEVSRCGSFSKCRRAAVCLLVSAGRTKWIPWPLSLRRRAGCRYPRLVQQQGTSLYCDSNKLAFAWRLAIARNNHGRLRSVDSSTF